jgi:hypothetical protein
MDGACVQSLKTLLAIADKVRQGAANRWPALDVRRLARKGRATWKSTARS